MSARIRPLPRSHRPVFLVNSRQSLFAAASSRWRPFSRSYGAFLPSSLTRVLPFALVSSTHLPVSVWGTGGYLHRYAPFLDSRSHALLARRHGITVINRLPPPSTRWLRLPEVLRFAPIAGTGIFTGCPSHTPPGFCLGPTHPTRTDLPSETLDLRRCRFSLHFATHARILTPHHSNRPCRSAFTAVATLSYHRPCGLSRTSVPGFSPVPFSAQSRSTSELLRTLSRMAASKPTSWLSRHDHIVSHLA